MRNAMKTDDFVAMLAHGVEAIDPHTVEKRTGKALAAGLSATLMLFYAAYGVRRDIGLMWTVPAFWLKFAFALAVLAAAGWMTLRLARPGMRAGPGWLAALIPVLLVWIAGAIGIEEAPSGHRWPLMLGHSWHICTLNITLLSMPLLVALLCALRGLTPTQPMEAGAAAGLLAGAISLFIYSWYCTEMAVQFWGLWYVLGMLVPTAAGALAGRTLLRW
jgi:hypothetical protein